MKLFCQNDIKIENFSIELFKIQTFPLKSFKLFIFKNKCQPTRPNSKATFPPPFVSILIAKGVEFLRQLMSSPSKSPSDFTAHKKKVVCNFIDEFQ